MPPTLAGGKDSLGVSQFAVCFTAGDQFHFAMHVSLNRFLPSTELITAALLHLEAFIRKIDILCWLRRGLIDQPETGKSGSDLTSASHGSDFREP
ncbi:hypothetical protein GA0061105_1314 [Rhizobium aethiopicum]|uniref:Uncharacterized protein n=1 Tax=Rhizobium aethiopicum TaxID=1138170 RepID=A0A1C3YCF2_9HYPH|nr:hypothetical protein GA0061105_1314 [Rhizobium aethiopicum]